MSNFRWESLPKGHPMRALSGKEMYLLKKWAKVMITELDLDQSEDDDMIRKFAIIQGYPDLITLASKVLIERNGVAQGSASFLHCDGQRSCVIFAYIGHADPKDNGFGMNSLDTNKILAYAARNNVKPEDVAFNCVSALLLMAGISAKDALNHSMLVPFVHARN